MAVEPCLDVGLFLNHRQQNRDLFGLLWKQVRDDYCGYGSGEGSDAVGWTELLQ